VGSRGISPHSLAPPVYNWADILVRQSKIQNPKAPLLGKGGVAAASADGVVRFFSSNPESKI
jgi:hypothetical protein